MSKPKTKTGFKALNYQDLEDPHLHGLPPYLKRGEGWEKNPRRQEDDVAIEATEGALSFSNYQSEVDAANKWSNMKAFLQCAVCDRIASQFGLQHYNPNESYDIGRDSHSHGNIKYGFAVWETGPLAICLQCLHGPSSFITPAANGSLRISTRIEENNKTYDWKNNKNTVVNARATHLIRKHKEEMKTNPKLMPLDEKYIRHALAKRAGVQPIARKFEDENEYPNWIGRTESDIDEVPDYSVLAMQYVPTTQKKKKKRKNRELEEMNVNMNAATPKP